MLDQIYDTWQLNGRPHIMPALGTAILFCFQPNVCYSSYAGVASDMLQT